MNEPLHFLNGNLVTEEKLLISPRDLGFLRGFAVFDFLRTYPRHRPFKLNEHIERLFRSASVVGISIPWTKEEVRKWTMQTLEANLGDPREKFIKIIVSGGVAPAMVPTSTPTIVILIDGIAGYPKEWYEKGVGVVTEKFERYLPNAKSNNYIEGVRQTVRAEKNGAMEPVYYSDAQVFEGSNSNIFAVIAGDLVTTKNNILAGITRSTLFEILSLDVPVVEKDFTFEELVEAQEVFLSASGKEIIPVITIDGKPVGDGTVGPITKEVMRQYADYVTKNAG